MKIVYVDFCNTLYRGYSLNDFLKFLAKESGTLYIFLLYILKFLGRIFFKKSLQNYLISFFSSTYLDTISTKYAEILEKHLIHSSVDLVLNLYKNNYKVVIVSAAFSDYIKKIKFPFVVDKILAISFKDNPINTIYGKNKVSKILEMESLIADKAIHRVSISDHISDIPMLEFADQAIVINPNSEKFLKIALQRGWEIIYG